VWCSSKKTIQRHWLSGGFVRTVVKKHLREKPHASGTYHLLKLVAFVLRRIIRADGHVTRLLSVFVRHFSEVGTNRQGMFAGDLVMSLT
jgi:hypothetical protein